MRKLNDTTVALANHLQRRRETVAVAESSSGGLISASLLAVPGASAYYLGGTVIYTIAARIALLGLSDTDVAELPPLSEAYVARCAHAIRTRLNASWGIAELGASGPVGTRYGHPPGISVLAVSGPIDKTARIETASDDREENMWLFAAAATALCNEAIAADERNKT